MKLLVHILIVAAYFSSAQVEAVQDDAFRPIIAVPRTFPAIKNAKTCAADDPEADVKDDELVLGVQIGQDSRAYPINMLQGPTREIINDNIGETALAATW